MDQKNAVSQMITKNNRMLSDASQFTHIKSTILSMLNVMACLVYLVQHNRCFGGFCLIYSAEFFKKY